MQRVYGEILPGLQTPILFVDNLGAVKLCKNPEFHKRSKHIQVRYFFIREKVTDGEIKVEHIEGTNQVADMFTKPLGPECFKKHREALGMVQIK